MDLKNLLARLNIQELNDIQKNYLENKSAYKILLAHTGSGKTLAFILDLLDKIGQEYNGKIIVISPSRELSMQIYEVVKKLNLSIKSNVCYGGHSFKNEVEQLNQNVQLIIGTPGRIADHIRRGTIQTNEIEHIIVDEFDKTLELGFSKELEQIIISNQKYKSIQLVSATVIDEIPEYLNKYEFQTIGKVQEINHKLSYFHIVSNSDDKLYALIDILLKSKTEKSVVFCTHRETTVRIFEHLNELGFSIGEYHGGMDQSHRELTITKFRNGTINIIVCTDLAARGLDISDVKNVIHYQYPHSYEEFTHRNGRSARVNNEGNVFMLTSQVDKLPIYLEDKKYKEIHFESKDEEIRYKDIPQTKWITLFINAGRKQKIRKLDILGFFTKEMNLNSNDIGIIEVMDSYCYVSIKKTVYQSIKELLHKKKIKKNSVKIVKSK